MKCHLYLILGFTIFMELYLDFFILFHIHDCNRTIFQLLQLYSSNYILLLCFLKESVFLVYLNHSAQIPGAQATTPLGILSHSTRYCGDNFWKHLHPWGLSSSLSSLQTLNSTLSPGASS